MHKENGFSLIEILIAVIVLAVSALGLAKLNAVQQKNNVIAADRQYATRLAEGILEEVKQYARTRNAPPSTLNGVTLTGSSTNLSGSSSTQTSAFTVNLRYSVAPDWIDDAATTDDSLAFKAQVNVSWTSADGQMQNVLLVNDIYQLKSAETVAPPMPACAGSFATSPFQQGHYAKSGTSVYYCTKAGGCSDTLTNTAEWKVVASCP